MAIQDSTRLWIHEDKLPKDRRPQRDVGDATMKKPVVQKLLKVRQRRYFKEGSKKVRRRVGRGSSVVLCNSERGV